MPLRHFATEAFAVGCAAKVAPRITLQPPAAAQMMPSVYFADAADVCWRGAALQQLRALFSLSAIRAVRRHADTIADGAID